MGGIPTGYNLSNAEAKAEKIQFEMIFQSQDKLMKENDK